MIRDERVSITRGLREYAWFYRYVRKYRDHVFLARFEDVISDFGKVMADFNVRFGTDFILFEHTADNEAEVFGKIEGLSRKIGSGETGVARPSESRGDLKQRIREEVMFARYQKLREQAESLYHSLLAQ